jgi:phage baseplate assembly protein W
MPNDFLGKGWLFPLLPDPSGRLGYVSGADDVEQSLRILLLTRLGERVMRPDFGCAAPNYVFAPGSEQFLQLLSASVEDAITQWEPRVDIEGVSAAADPDDETQVTVSILCRVRATNTKLNLVYPYYLDTTGGP